jgi:hypothetical protein
MTRRLSLSTLREQAASFGVAAVMTLAVLGSLAQIADHQHADAQMAEAAPTPVQVVVITGQRVRG